MFVVTQCIGGWQVRFETVTAPPIATFSFEADARMFAAAKEAQRQSLVAAARAQDAHDCAARVGAAFHGR
jgi:hypothetical protein